MSEKDVINTTKTPVTIDMIYNGLLVLGLKQGDLVLVHSSLSNIGWVCGGAQAVLLALMESVGEEGTIAMPSHSGDWSDPINWQHPPVPKEWVPIIRENMPAFDKDMTPTRGIGKVAELFRTLPDVMRSDHPLLSFSAWGKMAEDITSSHPLVPQMGITSPLGALYRNNAKILLLGVGFDTCTSFHLAETLIENIPRESSGTSIKVEGKRQWVKFEDDNYESGDFDKLGKDFEQSHKLNKYKIGNADCRLFSMREAVNFAKAWIPSNRRL